MSEFKDKFLMGSYYEGQEGMFQLPKEGAIIENFEEIKRIRKEKEIIPDVKERFEKILNEKEWEIIKEPIQYPEIDEWINFRIAHQRGVKFYPCFVKNKDGEIDFLKVQISNKKEHLESLKRESEIIQHINIPQAESVKFLEFKPNSEDSLSFLRLKAIKFSEGRVGTATEWTKENAKNAASIIRELETDDLNDIEQKFNNTPYFKENENINTIMMSFIERVGDFLPSDIKEKINNLLSFKYKPVLSHGDVELKNIIIKKGGEVSFIDWELACRGFEGRDAGQLALQLESNEQARYELINSYIKENDGTINRNRLNGLYLGMIFKTFTHLIWQVEKKYTVAEKKIKELQENIFLSEVQRIKIKSDCQTQMINSKNAIDNRVSEISKIINEFEGVSK